MSPWSHEFWSRKKEDDTQQPVPGDLTGQAGHVVVLTRCTIQSVYNEALSKDVSQAIDLYLARITGSMPGSVLKEKPLSR